MGGKLLRHGYQDSSGLNQATGSLIASSTSGEIRVKIIQFVLMLGAAPLAWGQLHFGVKGGVPLTDAIEAAGNAQSAFRRYTFGPMIDLDLPASLGVEFNALYKRTGYSTSTEYTSSSWEFPLLLKYTFKGHVARPYVSGGFVFRHIGDIPLLADSGSKGFAAAGGVRLNLWIFRISPELRYTWWNNDVFGGRNFPASSLSSSRNQVEALVGFTF